MLPTINKSKLFSSLPQIENVWLKQTKNYQDAHPTVYQLLTGYMNIDYTQLFYYRYKNQEFPNYFSQRQIDRYGHREKLTFTYYLKLGRPSIATKLFFVDNFKKYGKITSKIKYMGANLAHSIGLRHFSDTEVASACIAFVGMIGINVDLIRVHINAANILLEVNI